MNRVAQTLAHLLVAVEARQAPDRRQQGSRFYEDVHAATEDVVEASDRLAGKLEVGDLILADRHEPCVVHRDVGRLQQWIAEKPDRRQILLLQVLLLLLVGRHAFEPRHGHDHREHQEQLGVLGHQRLDEERAFLRIESGANPVGDVFVSVGRDLARVGEVARQRVPVGDEVETGRPLLQGDPMREGPDEVSEVQPARRPHA